MSSDSDSNGMQGCGSEPMTFTKETQNKALCRATTELATVSLELTDSTEVSISRKPTMNDDGRALAASRLSNPSPVRPRPLH
jgi:hypothetical protein